MNSKTLANKLDEKLFSDRIFKKLYVIYAFWMVLAPILETILGLLGLSMNLMFHVMISSMLFAITKLLEIAFNWRNIKLKDKSIIDLLVVCLFVWFMVSSLVNNEINYNFIYGLCYFLAFSLFFSLDKKYYKAIAIVFIAEMTLDTILSFIDFNNMFIPGFTCVGEEPNFVMSMQFLNPNWSALVVIIATMLAFWFVYKSEALWKKICYVVCFVVLVTGLFVGGSYAPETSLFLCELALVIYLWIKYKKCPWWVFSLFLVTIFISFAVWFVPAWGKASTASANYFYESLAVIDGKIHTHFVRDVSTFFNKLFGWQIIDKVPGSNGWDRGNLTAMAFEAITNSPKSFIIGYGAGYIYNIRVHNCYVALWMEFGFVAFALYIAIIIFLIVRFAKSKISDNLTVMLMIFGMLLFETMYCCIEPICYIFFVMVAGVLHKMISISKKEKLSENVNIGEENVESCETPKHEEKQLKSDESKA